MSATHWFILFGAVFISMGLSASVVKRLPVTSSVLYVVIGLILGPSVLGWFEIDLLKNAQFWERVTEMVVIISLFAAGLKLRLGLKDSRWKAALRLASISMMVTIGLMALAGVYLMGLSWGAAILLGAILAPTDPVLASDVQVKHAHDDDVLRFSLTGEAGFNDGAAFPFVMLGLGLLGVHEIGESGLRWLLVDVIWAVLGGLGIGALLGTAVSRVVMSLRTRHKETVLLDDFIALGLIALSYGVAILCHSYGFLAVFAAGLALRRTERHLSGESTPEPVKALAALGAQDEVVPASPEKVPAYTAQAILFFNEQLERLGEVALVILLGGMIALGRLEWGVLWIVPLLLFVIRPVAVFVGLLGSSLPKGEKGLIAWFGIRGIGSLYYLSYAIAHGMPAEVAETFMAISLVTMVASILLHGMSVTPLMNFYERKLKPDGPARKDESLRTEAA